MKIKYNITTGQCGDEEYNTIIEHYVDDSRVKDAIISIILRDYFNNDENVRGA